MKQKYKITLSRTADGQQQYLQIISADQFSTNIVLLGEFEVVDVRDLDKKKSEKGK